MAGLAQFTPGPAVAAPRPDIGPLQGLGLANDRAQLFFEQSSKRRLFERELEPWREFVNSHRGELGGLRTFADEPPGGVAATFRALNRLRASGVEIPADLDASQADFERTVMENAALKLGAMNRALEERTTTGGAIGALAGDLIAGLDDVETVATLPFGAPGRSGIVGAMLVEGLVGGFTEVVAARNRAPFLAELGVESPSDLEAFAGGAAASAVLGGTVASGIVIGRRVVARRGRKRAVRELRAILDQMPKEERALAEIASRQVLDDIEAVESSRVPSERAAEAEHNARAEAAIKAIDETRPVEIPDEPRVSRPVAAEPVLSRDETILLRPQDIKLEPAVFQFKSDADALGRTEALMGVTEWRPERAGIIIVYERADGSLSVADGHQRVNLATRIMAADPSQDIRLRAFMLREIDGVSVAEARVIAAMKNIAESPEGLSTARAKDAAKILRAAPEEIANLPAGPGIRRALELKNLSDEAFGMFINEVVPERFAAAIGRLAAERPEIHASLMRVLERTRPETTAQAESIVSQALESPTTRETQTTLFGTEEIARSLYLEKAKVLERALAILRKDRQVFGTLVRDQARIEGQAGNVLAGATNREITAEVENALYQIQKLAHRRGEIGDTLGRAAQAYADNGRLGDAAASVAESVRESIRTSPLDRGDVGGPGRATRPGDAGADVAEPGVADGSAQFAEVGGEGQRAQAEALAPRKTLDQDPPPEAFEPDLAKRDEIGELLDSGADRKTIDNHPVVVAALARMSDIPETKLAEGYGGDAWHAERIYRVDGEDVRGTGAVLPVLVERARRLAATATGAPHRGVDQNRVVTIVLGPPAAGKSFFGNELAHAKRSAILDSDDIKKTLPEYQGGIGANAVHSEANDLAEMVEAVLRAEGANIVYPKVGGKVSSITALIKRFKADGYRVEIINVAVRKELAYLRMMRRFVTTGRLVPPSYIDAVGNSPSATFRALKKKGAADGFAEIDNNGNLGARAPVRLVAGENPLARSALDPGVGERARDVSPGPESGSAADSRLRDRATQLAFRPREPEPAAGAPAAGATLDRINAALDQGGTISIATNLKVWHIRAKDRATWRDAGHEFFKADAGGGVRMITRVRKGRPVYDSIEFAQVTIRGKLAAGDIRAKVDEGPDGGEQLVIEGAERISDREINDRMLGRRAAAPMRGGDAEPGGLFGERQDDLFDSVPVVARLDQEGAVVVDSVSARELRDELDAEDNFLDDLEVCVK